MKYTREQAYDMSRSPPPEWFATPTASLGPQMRRSIFDHGIHRPTLSQVIDALKVGEYCMPPWQRGSVWSDVQRVRMLDSIMRGITVGQITLWLPPFADPTPKGKLASVPIGDRFVIDGQQRMTTLVMAARGDLDEWRWTGDRWHRGPGMMTPSLALDRYCSHSIFGWAMDTMDTDELARDVSRNLDRVHDYEFTMLTLAGSLSDMLETYERLATCGTPHTVVELDVMRAWARENGR